MKTLLVTLVLSLYAFSVNAKSLDDVTFHMLPHKEAQKECLTEKAIWGCFRSPDNIVFINEDTPDDIFLFVIAHEVGHYYLQGADLSLWEHDVEFAADQFAYWILGVEDSPIETMFFSSLLE